MRIPRYLGACVLTLAAVLVIGYLTAQAEGYANGYVLGLEGLPATAVPRRFAWELYIGMTLFGAAAVAGYRWIADTKGVEITVLSTMAASFLVSGALFGHAPLETAKGILAIAFAAGAQSPFMLALISVLTTRIVLQTRRASA